MFLTFKTDNFFGSRNFENILKFLFLVCPFVWGLFNFPLRILGLDLSMTPGDYGDPRLINYLLEHGYRFLTGNEDSFYNAPFFYPAVNTMSLSDNMMGSLPIYSLFRLIGLERESAFQAWWLSVFFLNYFISFYCFRKFSGNFYISVIAAWLFTFSLLNCVQLGFTQVNSKYMLPIIFLNFFSWLKDCREKNFYFFLLASLYQLLISVYFTVFTLLAVLVVSVIHFINTKSFQPYASMFRAPIRAKYQWLAIVVTALLGYLFLLPHFRVLGDAVNLRTYDMIKEGVPKFQSFVTASPFSDWEEWLGIGVEHFPNNWWNHGYFPGVFTLIVMLALPVYAFKQRKKINRYFFILLFSFIFLFFFCIRWNAEFSPLKFLYDIQFFGAINVASRILILIELVYLFLLLFMLNEAFNIKNKLLRFVVIASVLLFVMWDNALDPDTLGGAKKEVLSQRYMILESAIAQKNPKDLKILAVISQPNSWDYKFRFDAMMVSQKLGMKCINGHSSSPPNVDAAYFWINTTMDAFRAYCNVYNIDTNEVVVVVDPNPIK